LLTCAFCHARGSIFHILFNMLFLWWFGPTLERMYGSREFLLFYLAAAMISSLAYVALDLFTGDMVPAIGASGAVMAVTMLYAIFYPRHTIYIMFVIPVEIRWLVIAYVIFDLHPVLLTLAGDPVHTGVAHAAHLGGLAFGFLYWRLGLRLEPLLDYLPRSSARSASGPRTIRVRPSPPVGRTERLDAEVDAILQKIHEQGQDSLTDAERRVLELASEQYRQRGE
jgi:membrane associated rhomboid family serine protease